MPDAPTPEMTVYELLKSLSTAHGYHHKELLRALDDEKDAKNRRARHSRQVERYASAIDLIAEPAQET